MSTAEQLPVPPLRLRRIWLQGVGPDGARFDPLDLNYAARAGAADRVLLSLTNTGGKSTLITLVSSLVVPAAREQVGGKNLGDYVLTGDTSHIICEWEDDTTGVRTVTGTVMEWKDGRRQPTAKQRSTTNMHRTWYLFRTGPGLPGIDDLPFIDGDGRRSTLSAYMAAVRDLKDKHPEIRWVETQIQQEWTQALLEHTSIDPVLFSYQMRMNDDEAGAKALLEPFSSDDNVVKFFIGALNDDREFADFTNELSSYSRLAADRPNLLLLNAFCAEIEPKIASIVQHDADFKEASAAAIKDRISGAEFAGAVLARLEADQRLLNEQAEEVSAAEQKAAIAKREYNQISDIRLQLTLENSRAVTEREKAALAELVEEASAAASEALAWGAVPSVLDIEVARTRRDACQLAYEQADADLSPLRNHTDAAAAALAGRLTGLIAEHAAVEKSADDRRKKAEIAAKQANAESKKAAARVVDAVNRLKDIDAKILAASVANDAARAAKWLNIGETAEQCVRRWQDHRAEAKGVEGEENRNAAEADLARSAAESAKDALAGESRELEKIAFSHRGTLESFDRDLAQISDHPGVELLLGGTALTTAEISRVRDLAASGAHTADRIAAEHQSSADAAQEELRHLDETGTAPTGPDIMAVVTALEKCRIGAVTGLQWIEKNVADPDARSAFIAVHPDIAGGVIVTDPTKLSAAKKHLDEIKLRTRTPVSVVANPSHAKTTDAGAGTDWFVVIPHRATWDRQWAQDARAEYATIVDRESAAALRARDDAGMHRGAELACTEFLIRWSDVRRDVLEAAVTESTVALAVADEKRKELIAERDRQKEIGKQARVRADQARNNFTRADKFAREAAELVTLVAAGDEAEQRKSLVEAERIRAVEDEIAAEAADTKARDIVSSAGEEAAQARSNSESARRQLEVLGVEVPGPDPGGSLHSVRSAYEALRQELSSAEQGMVEAGNLDRAKADVSLAQERSKRFDASVLARAGELSVLPAASSSDSLNSAQRWAQETAMTARLAQGDAESRVALAETELRKAQPPSDRQNHIDLTNFPEWIAVNAEEIPQLLERLEERNIELRELSNSAEQEKVDAVAMHQELKRDVESFEEIGELWIGEPATGHPAVMGPQRDVRRTMRELVERRQQSGEREHAASDALKTAVGAAKTESIHPRWKDLDSHLVLRLRSLTDDQLIAEATTLTGDARAYFASTSGDLEKSDTHRTILRDSLVAICKGQRRLLREVSSESCLPPGLGELSGQPAIKIRFEDISEEEARGRLGERIDTWAIEIADNPKRASSSDVRTRWLAEAVRETVRDRSRVGAWSIEILKPRIDGQVMYCPPDRIDQEFSGGQILTLAVLVYCALSRVRSAHRTGGSRPPGTLLLDNPFGAASAETLISMQHRLAAHSGIQLVCATGLNEANVERAFSSAGSVIVKLRNDGDQRRNQSFLRIREQIVDGIDLAKALAGDRPVDSEQNWVEATRYEFRR